MTPFWLDRAGSVASLTCATHCLLLSLAPAILPLVGLGMLADESYEWVFFSSAIAFALTAALTGYRVHRTLWVVGSFGAGMTLLAAGRLSEVFELHEGGAALAISGGVVLAGSHLASVSRQRACQAACCDPA